MKTTLFSFIFTIIFVGGIKAQGNEKDTSGRAERLQQVRTTAFQQNTQGTTLKARKGEWYPGGSFGMAFGNRQTTISIAPQISYGQSPYFRIGGGITYNYYHSSATKDKRNYAGINLFGEVIPLPFVVFRLQPELYESWGKSGGQTVSASLVPTILVGGGIRLPLIKGDVSIMFYYDVLQYDNTPYGNNLFYTVNYSFRF